VLKLCLNCIIRFELDTRHKYFIFQTRVGMFVLGQVLSILCLCEYKIKSYVTQFPVLSRLHTFYVLTKCSLTMQTFLTNLSRSPDVDRLRPLHVVHSKK
jgi:hypothetical protein